MIQKINPHSLRVGVISEPRKTYSDEEFYEFIEENKQIRSYLERLLYGSNITKIEVERASTTIRIVIYTTTPEVVEKKCKEMEEIKNEISQITNREILIETKKVVTSEDFLNSIESLPIGKNHNFVPDLPSQPKPFNGRDFYNNFCNKSKKNKNRCW